MTPGARIRLPSGNVVILQRMRNGAWLCTYARGPEGGVTLDESFLFRWGVAA